MAIARDDKLCGVLAATAVFGALVMAAPSGATAGTIDVSLNTAPYAFASYDAGGNAIAGNVQQGSGDVVSNDNTPFWTATFSFTLTSANDALSITDLLADDRMEVELNGVPLVGAGIYGPGSGDFIFTPAGSLTPETFIGNGALSQTNPFDASGPFVVGLNTVELIVNNTGNGINGGLSGGPSRAEFAADVLTPSVAGTPEPETWLLLFAGVLATGAGLRVARLERSVAI